MASKRKTSAGNTTPATTDKSDVVNSPSEEDKTQAAMEAPVESAVPKAVEAPKPVSESSTSSVAPKTNAASKGSEALMAALKRYAESMHSAKPVSTKEIENNQLQLRGAIINGLTVDNEQQGIANIHAIMDFMHNDTGGAFKIHRLFRCYDLIAWPSLKDRQEIERLLMLFEDAADPKTRGAKLKRMDISGIQAVMHPSRKELLHRRLTIALNLN